MTRLEGPALPTLRIVRATIRTYGGSQPGEAIPRERIGRGIGSNQFSVQPSGSSGCTYFYRRRIGKSGVVMGRTIGDGRLSRAQVRLIKRAIREADNELGPEGNPAAVENWIRSMYGPLHLAWSDCTSQVARAAYIRRRLAPKRLLGPPELDPRPAIAELQLKGWALREAALKEAGVSPKEIREQDEIELAERWLSQHPGHVLEAVVRHRVLAKHLWAIPAIHMFDECDSRSCAWLYFDGSGAGVRIERTELPRPQLCLPPRAVESPARRRVGH